MHSDNNHGHGHSSDHEQESFVSEKSLHDCFLSLLALVSLIGLIVLMSYWYFGTPLKDEVKEETPVISPNR